MAQIETWLKCDLRRTVQVIPLKGHLFSADVAANRFGVEITDAGVPHPVSGTLMCYGLRHDGVTVMTQTNVSNTSRPSVVLVHDFYDVVGPIQIVLRLVTGNEETVLAACTSYVYKTTSDQLIDSGAVVPSVEALVERMNACERAADSANAAAASAQNQVNAAAASAAAAATASQNAQTEAAAARQSATQAVTNASNAAASAAAAEAAATNAATSARQAQQSSSAAQQAATAAETAASNAQQDAAAASGQVSAARQAAETAQGQVAAAQASATAAQQSASAAEAAARQAQSQATTAAAEASAAASTAESANDTASAVSTQLSAVLPDLVQGAEVRNDALYLLNGEGEVVAGPFSGFGGGGGGGGGGGSSNVTLTFVSADGNYYFVKNMDDSVVIDLTWSSLEDEEPTGNGTLKLTIGGVVRYNKGVPQGTLHEDVTSYLSEGENTLAFQITDSYGNRKSRSFTVNLINLRITSSFDDSVDQYGEFDFPFIPYGSLSKTVHFLVDGVEIATRTVSSYGRQLTQTIPQQTHGSHVLTVYYTATMDGNTVYSNYLHYDVVCITPGEDDVIITSSFSLSEVDQYATINVPYRVYNPTSQLSDVVIAVNGVTVNSLTGIDRTRQTFSYRLDDAGSTTISISSGNAMKLIVLTVNAVNVDLEAETEGLKLYLSSHGRSNNEANPAQWTYDQNGTTIAATFTDFNWVTDGWQLDDDGVTAMRVSGDARISIPYKPFQTDKRTSGFTIEIDFATRDVMNYDAVIVSCMNGGRGFELTSQKFALYSEGSQISMQFKDNEHVRATFVVAKRTGQPLIYCYINGIMSGVTMYPTTDNFAQVTPQNISIGSSYATIDLYTIRIYDYDLPMRQVETNWIADTPDGEMMLQRFGRNNIRNESDQIVIAKLPTDLPYMIITASELPQYKGDKKTCSGSYTDPLNTDKNFTFEECQIDVQGTSSQYYARKNYKMKFNGGFINSNGVTESKYKLRSDSIAVKTFCMKADVASSEGANNVELVRLYDDACPYKTPAQVENNKVRQGIDGFPIVIFWHNPDNNSTTFLGKYNFNNDKSTEAVFGFVEGDESWEIRNNTNNRVLWKSDDFTSLTVDEDNNIVPAWTLDFEARYPDMDPPYTNKDQLQELATWLKSTDPTQATNAALPEAVTYTARVARYIEVVDQETGAISYVEAFDNVATTFTTDSADYRKAKFRDEASQYIELQSAMFYYLFTELFLMVDSRAKNAFPSFMGTAIGGD